jgi:hypothetical protein
VAWIRPTHILGQRQAILQKAMNLYHNAIHFNSADGIQKSRRYLFCNHPKLSGSYPVYLSSKHVASMVTTAQYTATSTWCCAVSHSLLIYEIASCKAEAQMPI